MNAKMSVTMNARAKPLWDEALAMPDEDRAALAQDLLESLHGPPDEGVEEAWRAEIERRVEDAENGRGITYSLEETLARARTRLRQGR